MNYMRIIDHDNYYDGPLSGICEYAGKKWYFTTQIWGGWEYLQPGPKSVEESRSWPDVCIPRIFGLREIKGIHRLLYKFWWRGILWHKLPLKMVVSEEDRV